jgi:transposase
MRKLPAAAQEEHRRQVIGLRASGLTYAAIAAQTGLTQTGVFNICERFAEHGLAGLQTGPRGPAPGTTRLLDAAQEAEIRALICRQMPDELGLPYALWSRAAVRAVIEQHCDVRLAVRTTGTSTRGAGASPPRSRCGALMSSVRTKSDAGRSRTIRISPRVPNGRVGRSSGATKPGCAVTMCAVARMRRAATRRQCAPATSGSSWVCSRR